MTKRNSGKIKCSNIEIINIINNRGIYILVQVLRASGASLKVVGPSVFFRIRVAMMIPFFSIYLKKLLPVDKKGVHIAPPAPSPRRALVLGC